MVSMFKQQNKSQEYGPRKDFALLLIDRGFEMGSRELLD